jgi:hypothetical protein
MHRRDVLKALATIPIAGFLSGCKDKVSEKAPADTLEIHLEGAFALVLQENKNNSVLAFSPRPKAGMEQHQLYLNGSRKPEDLAKANRFTLAMEGLETSSKVVISPGLTDFFFETERWKVGDSLLTIELPAPREITFSGQRVPVILASNHKQVWMPSNHILKYDIKEASRIKLACGGETVKCEPSNDSFPGTTRYFFEVGPKQSLDHEQSLAHAASFFNEILRESFPDLADKNKLIEIPGRDQQASAAPLLTPAVYQYGVQSSHLQRASYIIDCEFGGPLVKTHSAPQG